MKTVETQIYTRLNRQGRDCTVFSSNFNSKFLFMYVFSFPMICWLKYWIFLRDRFHCQYCQRHFAADNLTIDHVIPKSRGGGMRWINVVTACQKCNLSKGAKIVMPSKTMLLCIDQYCYDSRIIAVSAVVSFFLNENFRVRTPGVS